MTVPGGWVDRAVRVLVKQRRQRKLQERERAEARRKERELNHRYRMVRSKLVEKQRQNWFNIPVDLQNASREEILLYASLYLERDEDPRISLESLESVKPAE